MTATIIVEDGTLVSGANSYATTATLATYADERGVTIAAAASEDLLIEAMDYIESLMYIGAQYTEDQALVWPRSGAVKKIHWTYDSDEIPQLLIDGLCEVALAIDAGNSPIANIDRATKKEKVGPVEVEYKDGSASSTIVKKINTKLSALLAGGAGGANFLVGKG
jgi:hypothetical protein